jgi:ribonucleoside-diphosphate reductase alpha chain
MLSETRPAKVGQWTEPALRVLRERYLLRKEGEVVETPEEMCWRVAVSIAAGEGRYGRSPAAVREVAEAFYDMMVDGYFIPNSPTLMNAGKGNGLQYSACYVLPVGDSMEEIFDSVMAAAIIHKCLVGDTLVASQGLTRLSEVQEGALVMTDEGAFHVSGRHDNGEQPVWRVTTHRGYEVVGTAEHRLLVVGEDGCYRWRPISDLREGDWLVMKAGRWVGGNTKLAPFTYQAKRGRNGTSFRAQEWELPRELTTGLAEFIGLYIGDGSHHRDGIRITVGAESADIVQYLDGLCRELFGRQPSVSRYGRGNAYEVAILSVQLKAWFSHLGLTKRRSVEAHIPEIILRASEEVACAFLRGLFTADGCVRKSGYITLTTASQRLGEEVQIMLLLLGIPTHRRHDVAASGSESWQVSVCTQSGFERFREKIGFLSKKKAARLAAVDATTIFVRGETIPNQRGRLRSWYDDLPTAERRRAKQKFDDLLNRVTAPRELTRQRVMAARENGYPFPAFFEHLATEQIFFTRVRGVASAGVRRVYDLTVPDKHAYLANGFVSHNSGGGTGFAFSRLRPKDDIVSSTGGRASGPVSFLRVFNGATEAVKQGGTRRGANMGILKVDHPDILEFIDCKLDGGITNFNISVAATDKFMDALARGEEYELVNPHTKKVVQRLSAREVFERIVRAAWRTGDPGMVFIDRINASPANPTPELGQVEATNPCITGDTLIYTARGLVRADALAASHEQVDVVLDARFDAGDWGPASAVFETGTKPVYRLVTTEGYELKLTADHRVMTARGWRRADELQPGDLLHVLNRKGGFGEVGSLEEGRLLGWLVGDGHIRPDKGVILRFYGDEKRQLAPAFAEWMNTVLGSSPEDRYHVSAVDVTGRDQATVSSVRFARLAHERFGITQDSKVAGVPAAVLGGSEPLQRGFLQALFTADGHVCGSRQDGLSVRLTSISLALLRDVQRMLLNFGIASRIYANRHAARTTRLPDGRGGTAEYACQADHDLAIARENVVTFLDEIGFLTRAKQDRLRHQTEYVRHPYREPFLARFEALEPLGAETVLDLKEPFTHSFVANGLVVHNCGEQPLLPNEACNLGSLNVSKFARRADDNGWSIDWDEMERVVRLAVRFLDDVIEMNPYPLPEIDHTVKANRRIGLGIMGWADLLFLMGIPYDSQDAIDLADRLMSFVKEKSHDQCAKLAEERGPFPNWSRSIYKDVRPMRNSTVTTIAPTGTISMIAGCSSGIEPIFALAFQHRVKQPDGERVLTFVNETFESIAREKDFYSTALMEEIARRGTLHDIPGIPEEAARVFKTSHEIAFEWHVRHQAAFQRYTDNGVSKTINLPNDASEADVANAYKLAWEFGCLGITVFRDGCKGEQVLNVGIGKKDKTPAQLPTAGAVVIRPRPHSLSGKTYRMETPIGTAFITVNETPEREPFEVFVQVGKGGSDTMAVAEALGRLISLTLRLPSPLSPQRRLEEVISQLSRIGGAQPMGFGAGKILSLPDALARTLAEHIGQLKQPGTPVEPPRVEERRKIGDLCKECGQATFVYEEGCKKCLSCGFNEC